MCTTAPELNLPKNKILIAFDKHESKHLYYKSCVLSKVFDENISDPNIEGRIFKNLFWKNKYYDITYDLYIDEFESLEEWLSELHKEEYDELREVLAGIIIVSDYQLRSQEDQQLLRKINECNGKDSFLIWCNIEEDAKQEDADRINNILVEEHLSPAIVEISNWHCKKDVNEFDEKLGVSRIKEIIDTHQWKNCDSVMELHRKLTVLPNVQFDEEESSNNLEYLLEKLQEARLRYQSQDKNDEDIIKFSSEIAEEIAKFL